MKRNRILFVSLLYMLSAQVLISQSNVSYDGTAGNSGSYNTSFGYYAGDVITGYYSTYNGYYAGKATTSGNYNVFSGSYVGYSNVTGDYNVYVGYRAAYNATGSFNTAIGHTAGYSLSSGTDNVFLGMYSGRNTSTGSRNVFLGYAAGYSATGSDNIFIGNQAGYSASGDDKLYIENSSSNSPLIYGEFDNDLLAINGKLGVGTSDFDNGQLVVDGKISTTKIYITTDDFPDYVFADEYKLLPLEELAAFINSNNHLPGIKPGSEIIQEGLHLGEMNIKLLEKIEELTLYIIDLDKKRELLKHQNTDLQKNIDSIIDSI